MFIHKELWFSQKIINENTPVSHLPRVNGVQSSPNKFDLDLDPCDLWPWPLWPWPWHSWLWPWTTFSGTRLKTRIFTFLTLVTLTFDLWPMTLTFNFVRDMMVLNVCACKILGLSVQQFSLQSTNRDTNAHKHTDGCYRKYYLLR